MEYKVMSYNICGGRDFASAKIKEHRYCKYDLSVVGAVIKECQPDICGLQEVRGEGDNPEFTPQAYELSQMAGIPYYYFGVSTYLFEKKLPYGNALLTKYPILHAEVVPIPDLEVQDEDAYYETRSILKAELDVPGGLTVLVSHFGLAESEKRNAVETLKKLLTEIEGPVIFMGDLNMKPDDEILAPVFQWMKDTSAGDMLPFTFSSFEPNRKIDYIFTSENIHTKKAYVHEVIASDHMPLCVQIETMK